MNRQEKEHIVEALRNDFAVNQTAFLVGYKGMDVAEVTSLRKELRDSGGTFKVAKVTLIKRAIHDLPSGEGLVPYLKDQIGVVFVDKEAPAVAKVLHKYSKQNQKFSLLVGRMDTAILSKDSVIILASLPSREVLLAKICGALNSPIVGLVGTLHSMLVKLLLVLKAVEQKKSES